MISYRKTLLDKKEPHKPIYHKGLCGKRRYNKIILDTTKSQEAFMAVLKMDED